VVAAPGVPVEAVRVLRVAVAGADPLALDRRPRLLLLVPIARARRIAADPQIPESAAGDRLAVFVAHRRRVAGNDQAAGTGPDRIGPVRDEHVQHFGGADAVENVD